jgi:flagellar basal body-associated protein FliL
MKKLGLILGLVNTLAIVAVLGLFVYTKMLYKRPAITESKERAKLTLNQHKVDSSEALKKAIVPLDALTSNLDPYTDTDGKQKSHFVTMRLALEIRSERDVSKIEIAKPVIMDKILQNLSKKKFEDLNQVQGRYVFRSQIIDAANEFLGAPIVTDVYFSDFLLQ